MGSAGWFSGNGVGRRSYANAELPPAASSATLRAMLRSAVARFSPRILIFPSLLALAGSAWSAVPAKPGYNHDIRPILSTNCFFCHGPDEKKREAGRRIDNREGALKEIDGVRAIVPGQPEESEMLKRVLTHDKDDLMPPPKSKRQPLTAEQVATLRKWIEQGAEYEGHWAFLPVRKDAPPKTKDAGWGRNGIDQFIGARLESEGMRPSPEADRATLMRRVSLDLLGLLPTPEEVRAFVADPAPDAYEKLVDRLLTSPHYGERWGRHWLDQARYADSNGYTIDSLRAMWPYRDWVIKALNDDLPFDQFTIEQLAGDLLPKPEKSQLIATAFHRNTLINEEGGTDKEQFRNEAAVDRVNTTGAVWLGLTVGCAQCHTHKFDPISHREFYQMFAFFNQGTDVNNKGETLPVRRGEIFGHPVEVPEPPKPSAADLAKRRVDFEKVELVRLAKAEAAPVAAAIAPGVKWTPASYLDYETLSGAGFKLLPDNSLLADGQGAPNDTYRVVALAPISQVAAVRLRVLTDASLPKEGPGMAKNGNFVLTAFEATSDGVDQEIEHAFSDHEQAGFTAAAAIDQDPKTGWAINTAKDSPTKMNADHEAVFVFAQPIVIKGQKLEFKLRHELNSNYLIGRFALEFTETVPNQVAPAKNALLAALQIPAEKRSAEQEKVINDAFVAAEAKAATKKKAENPDLAELMIMKEIGTPRPTFIHIRGDFLRNDEKTGPLQPGVIAAVQSAFSTPAPEFHNRLDLARWLVNPENPLTPRVTVNRMWMHYFGRGLVETDEDFGAQGSPPSHPELLDWLARTFVERGWSMKAMHRLIATSATYRQSSKARPDLAERDPRNLLLARQERVRVEAETVRDAALSASGLLDQTIGGPSVFPPQAEGVYAFTQNSKKWIAETGPNRFRRGMYTTFFRSAPYPLFGTFDAPDFQTVCTRRGRSNTPLQALTVANDPAFLEIAQGLAARVLREVPDDDVEGRIRRAFALSLCREPSAKELAILRAFHAEQLASLGGDALAAKALLTPALANSGAAPASAAAMVCVARAILNTDSFITRE